MNQHVKENGYTHDVIRVDEMDVAIQTIESLGKEIILVWCN